MACICSPDILPIGIPPGYGRSSSYVCAAGRGMNSCNPFVSCLLPTSRLPSSANWHWQGGRSAIAHAKDEILAIVPRKPNGLLDCSDGRPSKRVYAASPLCCPLEMCHVATAATALST